MNYSEILKEIKNPNLDNWQVTGYDSSLIFRKREENNNEKSLLEKELSTQSGFYKEDPNLHFKLVKSCILHLTNDEIKDFEKTYFCGMNFIKKRFRMESYALMYNNTFIKDVEVCWVDGELAILPLADIRDTPYISKEYFNLYKIVAHITTSILATYPECNDFFLRNYIPLSEEELREKRLEIINKMK